MFLVTDIDRSIPGYTTAEIPKPEELEGTEDWTAKQWQVEFDRSRETLTRFFAARDPLVVLARTAARYMVSSAASRSEATSEVRRLEQVEVEIAQAFVLMTTSDFKAVPTSPGSFVRYWALMSRHIHGFIRKQPSASDEPGIADVVRLRARLQTLYYRNLFTRSDCEETVFAILEAIDSQSSVALGYTLSTLFRAMVQLSDMVEARVQTFADNIRTLMSARLAS